MSSVNLFLLPSSAMNHKLEQRAIKPMPYHKDHRQYPGKFQLQARSVACYIRYEMLTSACFPLATRGMSDSNHPSPAGENCFTLASCLAARELLQTLFSPAHQSWWSGEETSLLSSSSHMPHALNSGGLHPC